MAEALQTPKVAVVTRDCLSLKIPGQTQSRTELREGWRLKLTHEYQSAFYGKLEIDGTPVWVNKDAVNVIEKLKQPSKASPVRTAKHLFAKAMYQFDTKIQKVPGGVSMVKGDKMEIVGQEGSWYFGNNVRTNESGIFPTTFVEICSGSPSSPFEANDPGKVGVGMKYLDGGVEDESQNSENNTSSGSEGSRDSESESESGSDSDSNSDSESDSGSSEERSSSGEDNNASYKEEGHSETSDEEDSQRREDAHEQVSHAKSIKIEREDLASVVESKEDSPRSASSTNFIADSDIPKSIGPLMDSGYSDGEMAKCTTNEQTRDITNEAVELVDHKILYNAKSLTDICQSAFQAQAGVDPITKQVMADFRSHCSKSFAMVMLREFHKRRLLSEHRAFKMKQEFLKQIEMEHELLLGEIDRLSSGEAFREFEEKIEDLHAELSNKDRTIEAYHERTRELQERLSFYENQEWLNNEMSFLEKSSLPSPKSPLRQRRFSM